MDLMSVMQERRSARAFTDEQIERGLLEELLQAAARAPSAMNMQPWEVHMVLGEERKRLSRRLIRAFKERGQGCAPGATKALPERLMDRARQCADLITPLVAAMDSDFRSYVNEGSLDFYGASAVALLVMDDSLPPERNTDIGVFAAYLVLAAACRGLASCPIGLVCAYQDEVKDHLNIPDSKILVLAVALGYARPEAPVNAMRTPRADLKEFVRWVE
jgi:nitroreductase